MPPIQPCVYMLCEPIFALHLQSNLLKHMHQRRSAAGVFDSQLILSLQRSRVACVCRHCSGTCWRTGAANSFPVCLRSCWLGCGSAGGGALSSGSLHDGRPSIVCVRRAPAPAWHAWLRADAAGQGVALVRGVLQGIRCCHSLVAARLRALRCAWVPASGRTQHRGARRACSLSFLSSCHCFATNRWF
jgi:hypothetical protein